MTAELHFGTLAELPKDRSMGIGIVGCGGVAQHGHMPAYRQAGLNVVGVASRTPGRAKAFADAWGVGTAMDDWRRLVEMPEVGIVDVTFPFDEERLEIVRAAASARKHILMQKPFAHSMEAAREMVRMASAGGVLLAVNQNARWCPQYRAAKLAIEQGLIGKPCFALHLMYGSQDSQAWWQKGWYARTERFQLLEYSVHHLDLLRWWWGCQPVRVKAALARKGGQFARGEMIVSVQMAMPQDGLAVMIDDNATHPGTPGASQFHIEGSDGAIDGEVQSRTFRVHSRHLPPGPHSPTLEGSWWPGGFVGTMGELMCAIEQGRQPTISGEDNLQTLDIVFQAYRDAGV